MFKAIFAVVVTILIFYFGTDYYYAEKNRRNEEKIAVVVQYVSEVRRGTAISADEIIRVAKVDDEVIAAAAKRLRVTNVQVAECLDFSNICFLARRKY